MAARTRAKDSDRDATCRILDDALGDGQLSGEEHRRRVEAAVTATTLGELEPLVADLQLVRTVEPPASRGARSRGPILAAAGVVAVVIVALGWGLAKDDTPAPAGKPSAAVPVPEEHVVLDTAAPTAAPDTVPPAVLKPVRDLLTAEGLAAVIDAIRARFGDTMGYELAISTDRATLARPDPADDRAKMLYPFRGGWDDPSQRSRSDTDDLTDLAAFDIPATAAAVAAAPATLNIAAGDVSSVDLDIDHLADEGALELLVKIVTKSGSVGYIYLDPAAKVKRVENHG